MSSEQGPGAIQEPVAPVQSEDASAVAVAAAPEVPVETESAEETQRPRVRLNPVVDPAQLKARPSIDAGDIPESSSPAATEAASEQALFDAAKAEVTMSSPPPGPPARAVEIPRDVTLDADTEAQIAAAIAGGGLDAQPVPVTPEVPKVEGEEAEETPPASEMAPGTKLTGTIQTVHGDNVFLDFGLRTTGVVSLRAFPPTKPPKVGDKIDVMIDRVDENQWRPLQVKCRRTASRRTIKATGAAPTASVRKS